MIRGLPRFLGDAPGPVDLAAAVEEVADTPEGGLVLRASTRRLHPEARDWYGTRAETVLHPWRPGPPARLALDLVAEGILRLRYAAEPAPLPDGPSDMLVPLGEPRPATHRTDTAAVVTLDGGGLRVEVTRDPLSVRVHDPAGRLLWATRPVDVPELEVGQRPEWRWLFLNRYAHPLGAGGGRAFLCWDLHHDERLHGLGEGFGPVDRRFAEHELWVREGYSNATPGVYKQVPFVWSTRGWGLFAHTTHAAHLDLGAREHATAALQVEDARSLDVFVLAGEEPAALLERYGALTGRPRVPPRWTFGLWMGRITYTSQAEVEQVAAELRERRIPCDVLHVDTGWFTRPWICDWRFDPERFPDPAGMCARLREQGFRLSVWQWPYVLVDTDRFAEARAAGALVLAEDGEPALLGGEWGDVGVIDVSGEAGRAWYARVLEDVLAAGVSAIKADFGEGADPGARYAGISPEAAHNGFPLLYNRTVFKATEAVVGERDAVIWARSGWAGSQRYPVHWSGDGIARFADLPCVLRSMLSFGLSGFAFYSHDIGGFSGLPTPELYVRWLQLAVFSSHARAHGTPPREPWAFGPEAEAIARRYLELRMRLVPYLVSEAVEGARVSLPLVRALALAFPADRTAAGIEDQFLLGRALLVAPVLDSGTERAVWLPAGEWVDFWTGERVAGGRWLEVDAALAHVPLWVRGGELLPLGPVAQHTGERALDPLTVQVCALDAGEARCVLHEEGGLVEVRARRAADGTLDVVAQGAPGAVHVEERG